MKAFSPRLSRTIVLAGALASSLSMTQPAAGQSSIDGTFRYDAAASDDVDAAVGTAMAGLNPLHRRFARGHIERANAPYQVVRIASKESTVSIGTDDRAPITVKADGERVRWRRPEGEELTVSVAWVDGALRQTLYAVDGERENLFRLEADGRTLTISVTVRNERLPEPIRYRLVYLRFN